MKFEPRDYQQAAHDAVIEWWKRDIRPCVVEAATGAGKSIIVAILAKTLYELSRGKRVLCLAPSKELVEQNSEKYLLTGEPCSIYSASIAKSLRHQVVFATEGTFKKIAKRMGDQFAGVIVDECHRITPTIQKIIDDMREGNPNLRVCGLSATPFRLGDGFVFKVDNKDRALPETQTKDPYFHKLVYSIGARELIDRGFLTPVQVGEINAKSYDTTGLKVLSNGSFSPATINAAFEGWGRETAAIVADIVAQSDNKMGVMIFAATVAHAKEVMASLHPDNARMIGGDINTKTSDREKLVREFKNRKFKYLVSVGTMTTGVDFTHVDVIAILRATESISLLQQIIGRCMRLHDGKLFGLLLDYAGNIDRHCPDGDIFRPEIKAQYQSEGSGVVECACPSCGEVNLFSARKNDSGFDHDENGYWVDLDKQRIMTQTNTGEMVPMPGHYGRRCQHENKRGIRCDYYWSSKECPACDHHNDITARYCEACKYELINPADRLIIDFREAMKDPTIPRAEEILDMRKSFSISRAGNEVLVIEITTPKRVFKDYFQTKPNDQFNQHRYDFLMSRTKDLNHTPRTVSYKKDGDWWKIIDFDKSTSEEILNEKIGG